MISQIFFLSARGDILINKDFRGDLIKNTPEIFYRTVKLSRDDQQPIFNIDGINYVFLQRYSLYFVATSRFNASPSAMLEVLTQLVTSVKDYCGVLSEEAIRRNFVLIYEILEEMFDFGYPILASQDGMKDSVLSVPEHAANVVVPRKHLILAPSVMKVGATSNPISNYKNRNEVFVDVIEHINVLFASSGMLVKASMDGVIKMKSYLTGNPLIHLSFNGDSNFEDVNFDGCVDDREFSEYRRLTISPPVGECNIMNFRVSRDFALPFKITPMIAFETPFKVELAIRIRCDLRRENTAKLVNVRCAVPEYASSVHTELDAAAKGQKAFFKDSERLIDWRIEAMSGDTDALLICKLSLSKEVPAAQLKRELGPVKMNFEIGQNDSPNLKIKSLVIEATEKENPSKWVRYLTVSDSYVARI